MLQFLFISLQFMLSQVGWFLFFSVCLILNVLNIQLYNFFFFSCCHQFCVNSFFIQFMVWSHMQVCTGACVIVYIFPKGSMPSDPRECQNVLHPFLKFWLQTWLRFSLEKIDTALRSLEWLGIQWSLSHSSITKLLFSILVSWYAVHNMWQGLGKGPLWRQILKFILFAFLFSS